MWSHLENAACLGALRSLDLLTVWRLLAAGLLDWTHAVHEMMLEVACLEIAQSIAWLHVALEWNFAETLVVGYSVKTLFG